MNSQDGYKRPASRVPEAVETYLINYIYKVLVEQCLAFEGDNPHFVIQQHKDISRNMNFFITFIRRHECEAHGIIYLEQHRKSKLTGGWPVKETTEVDSESHIPTDIVTFLGIY